MHYLTSSTFLCLLAFFVIVTSSPLSRRKDTMSFNFDFEHPGTGDVGTLNLDLSTVPVRQPFGDNPPPNVSPEIIALARSCFAASVTGEDIYCEVFQNEDCSRSSEKPSFCVVGKKFQRTSLEVAPTRHIFPAKMHGKMKCLICDKKTSQEACKKTGVRS